MAGGVGRCQGGGCPCFLRGRVRGAYGGVCGHPDRHVPGTGVVGLGAGGGVPLSVAPDLGQTEALRYSAGWILLAAAISGAFRPDGENEFPVLLCLFGVRCSWGAGYRRSVERCARRGGPDPALFTHLGDLTNTMITLPGGQAMLMALYRLVTQALYLVVLLPLAWRAYVRRQVR